MTSPSLILFSAHTAAPETSLPPAARVLAGHPLQTVRNVFSDPTGHFHAGTWHCEPGAWRIEYTEHEFCQIIEGRVRITDEAGQATELGPGDAFVIPAGFRGIWETLVTCRKVYAIFE